MISSTRPWRKPVDKMSDPADQAVNAACKALHLFDPAVWVNSRISKYEAERILAVHCKQYLSDVAQQSNELFGGSVSVARTRLRKDVDKIDVVIELMRNEISQTKQYEMISQLAEKAAESLNKKRNLSVRMLKLNQALEALENLREEKNEITQDVTFYWDALRLIKKSDSVRNMFYADLSLLFSKIHSCDPRQQPRKRPSRIRFVHAVLEGLGEDVALDTLKQRLARARPLIEDAAEGEETFGRVWWA